TLAERPDCNGPVHIANKRVPAVPGTAAGGGAPAYIQWFDATGISNPAPNTFGTCSVGNFNGPNFFDADLGLHKNFPIRVANREGMMLQFRFEALNAFNHPVWTFSGGPAGGSFDPPANGTGGTGLPGDNSTFGRITGSQSARTVQLGLKFIY